MPSALASIPLIGRSIVSLHVDGLDDVVHVLPPSTSLTLSLTDTASDAESAARIVRECVVDESGNLVFAPYSVQEILDGSDPSLLVALATAIVGLVDADRLRAVASSPLVE